MLPAEALAVLGIEGRPAIGALDDVVCEEPDSPVPAATTDIAARPLALPACPVQHLQAPFLMGLGLKFRVRLLRRRDCGAVIQRPHPGPQSGQLRQN